MKYLALVTALAAQPAFAQTICLPHSQTDEIMRSKFGATVQMEGITQFGHIGQVYANQETGVWMFIYVRTDGRSCLAFEGREFQLVDEPLPPMGQEG